MDKKQFVLRQSQVTMRLPPQRQLLVPLAQLRLRRALRAMELTACVAGYATSDFARARATCWH